MVRSLGEIASKVERILLVSFLCTIVLVVFSGIIVRYTPLSGQTIWTAELARLFLLWMTFWGAGAIERTGGHFRLELVDSVLSGKALFFLQLFIRLLLLVSMGILIWWTISYARVISEFVTIVLQWPEVVRAIPLLFGSLLLFTHCLMRFIKDLLRWREVC